MIEIKHGKILVIPDQVFGAIIERLSTQITSTAPKEVKDRKKRLQEKFYYKGFDYIPYSLQTANGLLLVLKGPLKGYCLIPNCGSAYKYFDQLNKLSEVFGVDSLITIFGDESR